MPFILVLILLTVPTYIWLNESDIPEEEAHDYGHDANAKKMMFPFEEFMLLSNPFMDSS